MRPDQARGCAAVWMLGLVAACSRDAPVRALAAPPCGDPDGVSAAS